MVMKSRKASKRERQVVSARQAAEEHKSGARPYLELPENCKRMKIDDSLFEVDFLPYIVGDGNPNAKKGKLYYMRTFWVHRNIGPNNEAHICLAKVLRKPCPVCEYRAAAVREADHDEKYIKAIAPSERQLFNLLDLKNKGDGVQLLDYSFHQFTKILLAKVQKYKDGRYDLFADPEEGLHVTLEFDEEKPYGWKCTGVEFNPRKKPISEELLDQCYCLDELLKPTPYKELKELFHQKPEEEDEDEGDGDDDEDGDEDDDKATRSSRKTSARVERDDEDDDEDEDDEEEVTAEEKEIEVGMMVAHEDHGECKVVSIYAEGTLLKLEDEDGEKIKGVSVEDCEVLKKKGKKKPKPEPEEDEDEEEEDDDTDDDDEDDGQWDDKPKKKPSAKDKKRGRKDEEDEEDEEEEEDED